MFNKNLTILSTDQDRICGLRGFTHVDSSFGNDSELVLQISLQASNCILLPWDILTAGVAAYPSVSWHSHDFNVVANDLASTVIFGTRPDKSDRVLGYIQDLRFTWSVWCGVKRREK